MGEQTTLPTLPDVGWLRSVSASPRRLQTRLGTARGRSVCQVSGPGCGYRPTDPELGAAKEGRGLQSGEPLPCDHRPQGEGAGGLGKKGTPRAKADKAKGEPRPGPLTPENRRSCSAGPRASGSVPCSRGWGVGVGRRPLPPPPPLPCSSHRGTHLRPLLHALQASFSGSGGS